MASGPQIERRKSAYGAVWGHDNSGQSDEQSGLEYSLKRLASLLYGHSLNEISTEEDVLPILETVLNLSMEQKLPADVSVGTGLTVALGMALQAHHLNSEKITKALTAIQMRIGPPDPANLDESITEVLARYKSALRKKKRTLKATKSSSENSEESGGESIDGRDRDETLHSNLRTPRTGAKPKRRKN